MLTSLLPNLPLPLLGACTGGSQWGGSGGGVDEACRIRDACEPVQGPMGEVSQ